MTQIAVPAENMAALDMLSKRDQEVALTHMLAESATWLAHAVEATEPTAAADFKAWISTVSEATRQKGLSEAIQRDAQKMVRRSERNLGLAVRKGQRDGVVAGDGERLNRGLPGEKTSPSTYFNGGGEQDAVYVIASASDEQFEVALAEADAEQNTSRANVVRKIKGQANRTPLSRDQKADLIRDLAEQGHSSHQMADKVGVTPGRVREIARAFGIEIPADKVMGRGGNRIDHTAAVTSAVDRLDHLCGSLNFIDFTEVDGTEADEWVASLTNSLAELRRFINKIKETTHV